MDSRLSSTMKKRREQELIINEAMWLYMNDRPYLGLLYGIDILYIDHNVSQNLLSLGLVYLGDKWQNKVPPIKVMGLEVKGFVRDVKLNTLVKEFLAAVEGNDFVERKINAPDYP